MTLESVRKILVGKTSYANIFRIKLIYTVLCSNNGSCIVVDFCRNITWKCFCLSDTLYYGEYCEHRTTALTVKQALTKSNTYLKKKVKHQPNAVRFQYIA